MRHLIAVLFAPRETYEQLREKVDWVTPLLVLGLLTALFNMIVDRTEFTLSYLVTNYGASVLQITVTVFLFGMILFTVKSLLRAESGTFRQLCKVKLFSMAPNLLYLLAASTSCKSSARRLLMRRGSSRVRRCSRVDLYLAWR